MFDVLLTLLGRRRCPACRAVSWRSRDAHTPGCPALEVDALVDDAVAQAVRRRLAAADRYRRRYLGRS